MIYLYIYLKYKCAYIFLKSTAEKLPHSWQKVSRLKNESWKCFKTQWLCPLVRVSCGCRNKWPQTRWLKTQEKCILTALEGRSPKCRCQQGRAPSEGWRGGSLLSCPVRLLAASNPWLVTTWLQFLPLWSQSLLFSVCPISSAFLF